MANSNALTKHENSARLPAEVKQLPSSSKSTVASRIQALRNTSRNTSRNTLRWCAIFLLVAFVSFVVLSDYPSVGRLKGRLNLTLARQGVWPWSKYQGLVNKYERVLSKADVYDDGALVELCRSLKPLSQIVKEKAKANNVSPTLIEILLAKESASGRNPAVRHEAKWMGMARRISTDEREQKMWASSHGPMQIAGWWVLEYNRIDSRFRNKKSDWRDLYNLEYNIELGVLIYKRCLEMNQSLPRHKQIWHAFRCYNGSGPQARDYAEDAYRRLADVVIGKM